ncbi:MAG TPA: VOC family protein [Egibacteraceae bacterium]|nr:VOC family protein [Egibacteraceae bacterium]
MLAECRVAATLPVKDLARVRGFYEDSLGLKAVSDRPDGIAYECGAGTMLLVFPSSGQASGDHTQVGFIANNFDEEVAELRGRGVRFEQFDMPDVSWDDGVADMGGMRGVWFRDPDGNLMALTEEPF